VPPVEEKVLDIAAYDVFWVVEYLQVAFSSVAKEILVEVVPMVRVPEGEPAEREGGVVSGGGVGESTLKEIGKSPVFAFPEPSWHRT